MRSAASVRSGSLTFEEVQELIASLSLRNEGFRPWLAERLFEQAALYLELNSKWAVAPRGRRLKQQVGDAAAKLETALDAVDSIGAVAGSTIEYSLDRSSGFSDFAPTFDERRNQLAELAAACREAEAWLGNETVRRRPLLALETAIGTMMLILRIATGNVAIERRRKTGMTEPKLISAEARVIGAILMQIDGSLSEGTIVNKMEKIRARARKDRLIPYSPALFEAHQLIS